MTRFARAKGSKSSNERLPERATDWSIMKEEMKRKQQEIDDEKGREEINKLRQQQYDDFVKQQSVGVTTEWAEFPEDANTKSKENKIKKTKLKSNKKSKDKMIPKEQILEMLKPDTKIDAKVEKLTSQINTVLNKKALKKDKEIVNNTLEKSEMIVAPIHKKNKRKKDKKQNNFESIADNNIFVSKDVANDAPVKDSAKFAPEKLTSQIDVVMDKKTLKKDKEIVNNTLDKSEIIATSINKKKKKKKDKKHNDASVEVSAKIAPEKLTSQIDAVLNKKTLKKDKEIVNNTLDKNVTIVTSKHKKNKKKKDKQNNLSSEIKSIADNNIFVSKDVDNDTAVEIGTNIAPSEIVVHKKKSLKIKPIIESMTENQVITPGESNEIEPKVMTKNMKKFMKRQKIKKLKAKLALEESANKPEEINEDANKNIIPKNRFNRKYNEPTNKRKHPNNEIGNETPNKFPRKEIKLKVAKVRDNKEHKRRKPDEGVQKIISNGLEIDVVRFEGFPVKKEDADRLNTLRKQMISKGIPRSEVKRTLVTERRKAEKALSREKKTICFQCRKSGHLLSECPEIDSGNISFSGSGICYKCGSTEHTHFQCKIIKNDNYKFASCFICREQGHISKQCPDNPKGLYPDGGACKLCGDVTHFKKDCPQSRQEKEENAIYLKTISGDNIESVEEDLNKPKPVMQMPAKNKIIKF